MDERCGEPARLVVLVLPDDLELAGSRVRAVFMPLVDLAELAGMLAVIAMGVWALQTDRLTLGGLLAFLTLMAQCYRPIRDLADLLPAMYSATAGIERIVELLDEKPPEDRPGATPLRDARGVIRLEGVSVRYPSATADALADGGAEAAVAVLDAFDGEPLPAEIYADWAHDVRERLVTRREQLLRQARRWPELLEHELEHVRQWKADPLFPLRYTLATLRHGYYDNPYEVQARAAASRQDSEVRNQKSEDR